MIEAAPKGKGKPGPVAVVPGRSGPQRPGVVSSRPKSTTTPPARRRTAAPPPQRGGGVVVFGLLALLLLAGLGVGGYFLWPYTPFNSSASPSSNSALPSPPVVDETEWQPLFDGESLKGWTPVNKKEENNWGAEHGLLYTRGLNKNWLMTEKQYGDFEVHLDYRATAKANSGVVLCAPLEWDPSYKGMEIQILDDTFQKGDRKVEIKALDSMGSIWDVAAANRPAPKPAGEWNHLDIRPRPPNRGPAQRDGRPGRRPRQVREGQGGDAPGILRTNTYGHLGLQSLLGRVDFKNIEVRRLPSDPAEPKTP